MGQDNVSQKKSLVWLICLSLVIAGIFLIADAIQLRFLMKLNIKLGTALLFSAIALISGKDKPMGIAAIAIVWIAVIVTILR